MSTAFAKSVNQKQSFPFADRKLLAELHTRFCVSSVKDVVQHDGKNRWYLTIHYEESGEYITETLTMDKSPSRDKDMELLCSELPGHNIYLEKIALKKNGVATGQTYYAFRVDERASCSCGLAANALPVADEEAFDEEETPF